MSAPPLSDIPSPDLGAPDAHTEPVTGLVEALRELHTLVKGECPSLLNEDSGGDAMLAMKIEALLSQLPEKAA